ncbi:lycopene cyclase domain-containing protein [Candidatus Saccharibacteria bacterium]|nr:lycopene cyclase domain-containing protein [Candidatus Saccharibacteria bacterium]
MDYVVWLLLVVWIPLGVLWLRHFNYLKHYVRTFRFVVIASLIIAIPWDILAVQSDIWHYFDGHHLGIWLLGLPIEEYLYILTVSVYVATATLLIRRWVKRHA